MIPLMLPSVHETTPASFSPCSLCCLVSPVFGCRQTSFESKRCREPDLFRTVCQKGWLVCLPPGRGNLASGRAISCSRTDLKEASFLKSILDLLCDLRNVSSPFSQRGLQDICVGVVCDY